MEVLYRPWPSPDRGFGNVIVVAFLVVQVLDGVFTYLGVTIWGPSIEANPLIGSAVAAVGLGTGLTLAKLVAALCGIMLHLRRVHTLVALLTVIYLCAAILPWSALFLGNL